MLSNHRRSNCLLQRPQLKLLKMPPICFIKPSSSIALNLHFTPRSCFLCQALLLCVPLPDAAEEHVSNSWENNLWLNKMLQITFLFMLICRGWWFLVFMVSNVVCYKTICKLCLKLKWDHRGFCVMFWKHLALHGDFSHPSEKLVFHFLPFIRCFKKEIFHSFNIFYILGMSQSRKMK